MGSPLSPVLANIFMEDFETSAINSTINKPSTWLRYVDDIFVIWPHGEEQLNKLLEHLNNIHENINFTMEKEINNEIPFLDILITKKQNGDIAHTVYRKKTHTNRYVNAKSNHHPAHLKSVIKSLITRSERLADASNKQKELNIVKNALQQNGFSINLINKVKDYKVREKQIDVQAPRVSLPYIKGTTDVICRILRKHNIYTAFTTTTKIKKFTNNHKDKIPFEDQGVYEIPCKDCEKTYIGQTNRRINVRIEEHKNSVKQKQTTSSLAQHILETGHKIDFDNTKTLARSKCLKTRIVREAMEIEIRPFSMNKRDDSLRLANAWKPILNKMEPHFRTSRQSENAVENRNQEIDAEQVTVSQSRRLTRSQTRTNATNTRERNVLT